MNRDRIYEIEKRIASGQALLIERRPQIRNYFVGIEGKLIAVGYNTYTKRVVTALPAFNYPQVGGRARSLIRYPPGVISPST
jgi:hypothetical protein